MSVKLLTEHYLMFLRLKGGCTGSSESTLVKISHYWKSHVVAHMSFVAPFVVDFCLSLVLYISLHVLTSLTIISLRACVRACVCVCVCVRVHSSLFHRLVCDCDSSWFTHLFCTDPTCVNWNIYTSRT